MLFRSKIEIGDVVYTKNENSNLREPNKVEQLFCREYDGNIIVIETDNGVMKLTPNHKVFTINRGWVRADDLNISDELEDFNEQKL